jgi:2-iminobutanoate/2-iminopropanoate deaminase
MLRVYIGLSLLLATGCAGTRQKALEAEGALGPYSAAVLVEDLCFVSGKIGEQGGTFAQEVETAIDAVERELARVDLDLGDVVAATVYLTDMQNYSELNEVYARRFTRPYPARACVAVKELPRGARVEIMVTAVRG